MNSSDEHTPEFLLNEIEKLPERHCIICDAFRYTLADDNRIQFEYLRKPYQTMVRAIARAINRRKYGPMKFRTVKNPVKLHRLIADMDYWTRLERGHD